MPIRAFTQCNAVASVVLGASRLSVALVLVVLLFAAFGAIARGHELTPTGTVEEVLEKGLRLAKASPAHLAVRGTGVSNSTRCDWRGIARTSAQRNAAVRYWLGLSATDTLPSALILEILFAATLNVLNPEHKETIKSNFSVIARGGHSTEYLFLTCYVDYTANEYLLGAGPTTLTLAFDRMGEAHSYALYKKEHAAGQFGSDALLSESAYQAKLNQLVWDAETSLSGEMTGRETVVFLAPMGTHNAIAVEVWQVVAQWDVQTVDGTVNAIRHGTYAGDPEHTQTLSNLKSRVTTAAGSDAFAGRRIANASGLQAYYRQIGAYADITPDDDDTTTFTPAQPPPACGGAVPNPRNTPGLRTDCETLLLAKDALAGTATLNWSGHRAISGWDGITVGGSPSRVTGLNLPAKRLSGSIPPTLGTLAALTALDLSGNALTGEIPPALGQLTQLATLKLAGNPLTGCIPLALRAVAVNDLASLNLFFCLAPPQNLSVGVAGETSVGLTWDAVPNVTAYRVEYATAGSDTWTVADDTITATTYTVEDLACASDYRFRVSAYGDGSVHAAAWSAPSAVATASTTACASPVFDAAPYAFAVDASAATGTGVGTVSATDPTGGAVTYALTAGNEAGTFAIDGSTGQITVAGAVFQLAAASHTLTVQASGGTGGTATAAVAITVTSVCGNGVVVPNPAANSGLVGDCLVLYYGVRETLAGTISLDWSATTALTTWQGVRASGEPQRVQRLLLGGLGLNGSLPAALSRLTELRRIDLYENALIGPVPPALGRLSKLTGLYLFDNNLTGAIPKELGQLTNLTRLDLDTNQLTGAIPSELGNIAKLTHLHLFANSLTGEIPSELGSLANLEVLDLNGNQLSGGIPTQLGSLSKLNELILNNNQLTGSIPSELGNLANLTELWLTNNQLSGALPAELAKLSLEYLFLAGNTLTGCVPARLRNVANNDLNSLGLANCVNRAPTFGQASYAFSIAKSAAVGKAAGTVAATDPDPGDTLSYAITAGNTTGTFAINASTGEITLAAALNRQTTASYTLTVKASDGNGGEAAATVVITVLSS